MKTLFQLVVWIFCSVFLAGCGGGNSTVTTITGAGLNALGASPSVSLPFVQTANNLRVSVESGPAGGFSGTQNANILYATVTVCAPSDASRCQIIDHVQIDTGSVGLRIFASKVSSLNLPQVTLDTAGTQAWECYPFVIGGLWGGVAVADLGLGQQWAKAVPIQLIQDGPTMQAPQDCAAATNNQILSSVSALGSNGILGIGSVTLDCGQTCLQGNYAAANVPYEQYRGCPHNATDAKQCASATVQQNQQGFNPLAALDVDNNGVVLLMPAVTGLGAETANGELIFGINTQANNQLASGSTTVHLGVDLLNNPDSYLAITTQYNGQTIYNSYLDTGTNGLFFADSVGNPIAKCLASDWYCPPSLAVQTAVLSDGDSPQKNQVNVQFGVGNANALFSTTNAAFGDLAGAPPVSTVSTAPVKASFSWGMPFFYGKKVFLSIWDPYPKNPLADPLFSNSPWYSWSPI